MKKSKNIFNDSIGCGLPGWTMRLITTRLSASVAMMVCTAFFAVHAAETARYPVKPIRFVVPQQVVVDNRAGAGGVIGMEIAAAALPDGYTLLSMATAQVISTHLQKNLAYDTFRDFAPISRFGATYNVLIAHPSVTAGGAKEFVALAKSRQGRINMVSAGPGSQSRTHQIRTLEGARAEF